jgi:hypothetical protein
VFSASVNHLQLNEFLIKPFHQQSCVLAKVNQTICGSKFEERYFNLVFEEQSKVKAGQQDEVITV